MGKLNKLPGPHHNFREIMDSTHVPAAIGIIGMLGSFTLADINLVVGIAVGVTTLCYLILKTYNEWRNK